MTFASQNRRSKYLNQFEKARKFAADRAIEFRLTADFVEKILEKPCFMCGDAANTRVLARIDTLYGYHDDNVGACCWTCVGLRGPAPLPQLLEQAAKWLSQRELIEAKCEGAVQGAQRRRKAKSA